jgi:antitoxin ParD1/3/4
MMTEGVQRRVSEETFASFLAWAKPYLDKAEADIARGDVITLEEHRARNAARLAALRDCVSLPPSRP